MKQTEIESIINLIIAHGNETEMDEGLDQIHGSANKCVHPTVLDIDF